MLKNKKHYVIITIIMFIMFLPLAGTFLYSISEKWQGTVLPQGFTIKWYIALFRNSRFLAALCRSLFICFASLIFTMLIMIPSIFIIFYYYPKLKNLMEILVIMPFAIPAVVLSVGLLEIYSKGPFALTGTFYILIFSYFIIALPFVYRGIKNSFDTLDVKDLIDAAHVLGASTFKAFIHIIIPNLKKGLIVSSLLTFSFLFGEFLFANMLVGGKFETVQVFLFDMRGESGHFTSAIVITYFIFILITTVTSFKIGHLMNSKKGEKNEFCKS